MLPRGGCTRWRETAQRGQQDIAHARLLNTVERPGVPWRDGALHRRSVDHARARAGLPATPRRPHSREPLRCAHWLVRQCRDLPKLLCVTTDNASNMVKLLVGFEAVCSARNVAFNAREH